MFCIQGSRLSFKCFRFFFYYLELSSSFPDFWKTCLEFFNITISNLILITLVHLVFESCLDNNLCPLRFQNIFMYLHVFELWWIAYFKSKQQTTRLCSASRTSEDHHSLNGDTCIQLGIFWLHLLSHIRPITTFFIMPLAFMSVFHVRKT